MSTSFSIWKKLDEDGDMAVRDGEYTVLFIKPDRAIELRDLLLREFPVAGEWCVCTANKTCAKHWPEIGRRKTPHESRRERIATAANGSGMSASTALEWADALIALLDRASR